MPMIRRMRPVNKRSSLPRVAQRFAGLVENPHDLAGVRGIRDEARCFVLCAYVNVDVVEYLDYTVEEVHRLQIRHREIIQIQRLALARSYGSGPALVLDLEESLCGHLGRAVQATEVPHRSK